MAQLFLADVHNNTSKSTDTIYEIKAPLASFDTIDLDEDTLSNRSVGSNSSKDLQEKGIKEPVESESQGSSFDLSEERATPVCVAEEKEKKTEKNVIIIQHAQNESEPHILEKSDSLSTIKSDTDKINGKANEHNGDMIEPSPNSSENNASAEEIQNRLKVKGRKHKEKSSKVKYEKIDNSDISDQERSSPMPALKFKMEHSKSYSTDSDSSDSDNGYIHGGFIATSRGSTANRQIKPGPHNFVQGLDFVDSDTTPYSSPKCRRPTLPPPLSKEDAEKQSKKKAYEKRLQRMQVTTNPIERPRSTTPINIVTLDEYASISSPEPSPCASSHEKLKIILPAEETCRSPRRTPRADGNEAFNFSEDSLFTHTRSAFLLEDGSACGASPKKILVPPTLSPKLSPARSPLLSRSGSNSPRYYYSPSTKRHGHSRGSSYEFPPEFIGEKNWANFDNIDGQTVPTKLEEQETSKVQKELFPDSPFDAKTDEMNDPKADDCKVTNTGVKEFYKKELNKAMFNDDIADFDFDKERNISEEILTIKIETRGDVNTCDITCDVVNRKLKEYEKENDKHSIEADPNNDSGIAEPENIEKITEFVNNGNPPREIENLEETSYHVDAEREESEKFDNPETIVETA